DMSNIAFTKEDERDEVKAYATTKCIAPMEAMYIIFSLKTYYVSHSITTLDVHLPNRQMVFWQNGQLAAAARQSETMWTTLTAWFELNKWCAEIFHPDNIEYYREQDFLFMFPYTDVEGQEQVKSIFLSKDSRGFLYHDIPKHFVFHKESNLRYWDIRKKDNARTLGRMFHVRPTKADDSEKEWYYLRQ